MGQQVERIKILYYNKYNTFNSIIMCINTKEGVCVWPLKKEGRKEQMLV